MSQIKLFVAAKACIVNQKGELLLIRESGSYKDGSQTGKWEVPGGRLEENETLIDGLKREVQEESGLVVETCELIDAYDTFLDKQEIVWHIVRLFYIVTCKEDSVKLSSDHDAFIWLPLDKVAEHPGFIQNIVPTIEKIIRRRGSKNA